MRCKGGSFQDWDLQGPEIDRIIWGGEGARSGSAYFSVLLSIILFLAFFASHLRHVLFTFRFFVLTPPTNLTFSLHFLNLALPLTSLILNLLPITLTLTLDPIAINHLFLKHQFYSKQVTFSNAGTLLISGFSALQGRVILSKEPK